MMQYFQKKATCLLIMKHMMCGKEVAILVSPEKRRMGIRGSANSPLLIRVFFANGLRVKGCGRILCSV